MDNDKLTKAYDESTQELTRYVESWLRVLKDPFKPPEVKTGLPQEIGSACFKQAALYYALCNYGGE